MPPASCWTRPPSIRTSRAVTGTVRLPRLAALARKHGVQLIAIGNGTASRETDKLAGELMRAQPQLKLTKLVVSEAGASVYSASELAAKEFPQLDVSFARRRLHRAPPAGSAGRTGEDRAEVDRRRPVPARRQPGQAGALAGRGSGRLRQCRGRGSEYGLGAAAHPRLGPERHARRQHRRLPRRPRRVRAIGAS